MRFPLCFSAALFFWAGAASAQHVSDLGVPGAPFDRSAAVAVNRQGKAVGTASYLPDPTRPFLQFSHAMLWDIRNGKATDLGAQLEDFLGAATNTVSSLAVAINEDGLVVLEAPGPRVYLADGDGGFQDLGSLSDTATTEGALVVFPNTYGGPNPNIINAEGDVVAWSTQPPPGGLATVIWDGADLTLVDPAAPRSEPFGVNDRGDIVITLNSAFGPALLDADGGAVIAMLDLQGRGQGSIGAMNGLGQVGGVSPFSNPSPFVFISFHAVIWSPEGGGDPDNPGSVTPIDLGSLGVEPLFGPFGAEDSRVTALNDSGQAAGFSTTPASNSHAFFTEPPYATPLTDLGTLGTFQGPFFSTDTSAAVAMDDRGDVVGKSTTTSSKSHAFVWDKRRGMRDLGSLDGDPGTSSPAAITHDGRFAVGKSSFTAPDGTVTQHAVAWLLREGDDEGEGDDRGN
jgi:probable HAF family extracellular repeat protein